MWVAADIGRWHGGPAAGDLAVFAAGPAGCAALELELVDVEAGQVAVEADPGLFAALVEGEPWTVWASPAAGWEDQCPPDSGPSAEPGNTARGGAGTHDDSPGGTAEGTAGPEEDDSEGIAGAG